MKAKPILAVVCVCAAAGVGTWNVHYFTNASRPAPRGPVEPPPGDPGAAAIAPDGEGRPAPHLPAGPVGVEDPARGAARGAGMRRPAARSTSHDDGAAADSSWDGEGSEAGAAANDGAAATESSQERELSRLFEQLVQQNALRAAVEGDGSSSAASTEPGSLAANDGWDKLELRGVIVGAEASLALVNGRLLRVGDELPFVRYRIVEIRSDRLIAALPIGGVTRALTLHVFESPNRKVGGSVNPSTSALSAPASASQVQSWGGSGGGNGVVNGSGSGGPGAPVGGTQVTQSGGRQ
jgi:hypothetical protein